ncbi:bifunctional folylpolyglutamate synthase/dihydrofolate synthase [Naasia lichenicola]|uniref:bifunctional folylpolyglutamate synthase/dihydrofolate synthase n=1 Tax=Naasia lichenicola TaxID=2565933 RepID=UPI001E3C204E|nr:Mur ligase family protein [Naasia lichenicola]
MRSDLDSRGVFAALLERIGEAQPEPRLSATRRALELLGDPQKRFPFIHVTGTNGKTSTSRMAADLLRRHGLHVGLFTSPHLARYAERIAIDGRPAPDKTLGEAWDRVRPVIERVDAELQAGAMAPLTFFEALTALMFQVFSDCEVDAAVIEVGMGGEWDSTNVGDGRVAVIAPIALDHTRQLGSTLSQIAHTKSGIIKPGSITVTAVQAEAAHAVIAATAESVGSQLLVAGRDFDGAPVRHADSGQVVTLRRSDGTILPNLELSLLGAHQSCNAALAVAAVDALLGSGVLQEETVRDALAAASSPGRLQIVGRDPLIIVDAAHNPAGADSLNEALRNWPGVAEFVIVLGVLEDKDARGIIRALSPMASAFYVTSSPSSRALPHGALLRLVREISPAISVHDASNPVDAVGAATAWARARMHAAVVVTGSITLIGDMVPGLSQTSAAIRP